MKTWPHDLNNTKRILLAILKFLIQPKLIGTMPSVFRKIVRIIDP